MALLLPVAGLVRHPTPHVLWFYSASDRPWAGVRTHARTYRSVRVRQLPLTPERNVDNTLRDRHTSRHEGTINTTVLAYQRGKMDAHRE